MLRNILLGDVLLREDLRESPVQRDALHIVLNWSVRLLWALRMDIHVDRFLSRMLWVIMATGMLGRGALKWDLSGTVDVDGRLSGWLDWMGMDAGISSMPN